MKLDLTQDILYYNQRIEQAKRGIEWNTKAIQMALIQKEIIVIAQIEHIDAIKNLLGSLFRGYSERLQYSQNKEIGRLTSYWVYSFCYGHLIFWMVCYFLRDSI